VVVWIDLSPGKLNINYFSGVNPEGPIIPRCYTLTHSDLTGDLFLSIGREFDEEAISGFYTRIMRDEVLAEWVKEEDGYSLNVYCHVSGGFVVGTAGWRYRIFKRELPLVLKAICKGDNDFFIANPNLESAPIFVHFQSKNKKYHKMKKWGKTRDYR
jgi:hypothetical protein